MAVDLLMFGLATRPSAPAVITSERALTFEAVHARAAALARHFQSRGLAPGERVALLAGNEIQYLEIQVACLRAGLVLVPMNFRLTTPEISYILSDCTPGLVILAPELRQALPAEQSEVLVLDAAYEQLVSADAGQALQPVDPAADCTILYTSGTTGRPKGAVLTNAAMFARLNANLFEYQVRAEDVFLQCLPLFHIASNVSYTYTYAGATNVFLKDFHPLEVLDLIEQHGVTTALLVPTMINTLVRQPETAGASLASLEKVAYGASPIAPTLLAEAIRLLRCDFLQLYGMTETSAATVLRPAHHDPAARPELLSSAGQVALGMETRVVDDADQPLPAGAVGELVCRGDAVMRGYWNNEAATGEVLRDGLMHTGDMGYRTEEGFFYVTDRKKDMIVTGGENVYPREVEDVLFAHPGVVEAAVIGVPDDKWGERVHALVVSETGQVPDTDELLAFMRQRLAGYKVPKSVELVASLPKNATGKVLKTELRKPFWEGRNQQVS